jgi:hypothetical protein
MRYELRPSQNQPTKKKKRKSKRCVWGKQPAISPVPGMPYQVA